MTDISLQKVTTKFHCKACDYSTSHKGNWMKHLSTHKHKILTNTDVLLQKVTAACHECPTCGKCYKHRQSLHTHRRSCGALGFRGGAVLEALKEISEKLDSGHGGRPPVNIQVFLSQACHNAMSVQQFSQSMEIDIDRLCTSERVDGLSQIILDNLLPIPIRKRPVHCMDQQGREWMVKDHMQGWTRDKGTSLLEAANRGITRQFQNKWAERHPGWKNDAVLSEVWSSWVATINRETAPADAKKILTSLAPECAFRSSGKLTHEASDDAS